MSHTHSCQISAVMARDAGERMRCICGEWAREDAEKRKAEEDAKQFEKDELALLRRIEDAARSVNKTAQLTFAADRRHQIPERVVTEVRAALTALDGWRKGQR